MKVELAEGIANLSGVVSKNANGRLEARTFTRADGTKFTRMYFIPKPEYKRKPTPEECAHRLMFKRANQSWLQLTPTEMKRYQDEWRAANFTYNGKQYSTLRGYYIARYMKGDLLNP